MKKIRVAMAALLLVVSVLLAGCSTAGFQGGRELHPGHPGHEVH